MANAIHSPIHSDSLADVLERVLDKGVVVAGDVAISLVGIELLSIRLRLLITTVDKAVEMGVNWWEADPHLSARAAAAEAEAQRFEAGGAAVARATPSALEAELSAKSAALTEENRALRGRLAILEKRVAALGA